jgi:hypothetical protein
LSGILHEIRQQEIIGSWFWMQGDRSKGQSSRWNLSGIKSARYSSRAFHKSLCSTNMACAHRGENAKNSGRIRQTQRFQQEIATKKVPTVKSVTLFRNFTREADQTQSQRAIRDLVRICPVRSSILDFGRIPRSVYRMMRTSQFSGYLGGRLSAMICNHRYKSSS